MRTKLLLCGTFVFSFLGVSYAQNKLASVDLKLEGSAPYVENLYECAWKLDKKPYSSEDAQKCLASILASGLVSKGEIVTSPLDDRIRVVFVLKNPELTVGSILIQGDPKNEGQLRDWLSRASDKLSVGTAYSDNEMGATQVGIEAFYRSIGQMAGVSSTVALDQTNLKASVTYDVELGPKVHAEPALPPYGEACTSRIVMLNWSDVDDRAPTPILNGNTKVRAFGCFDQQFIRLDEQSLRSTGLFEEVTYTVGGTTKERVVSLKARGRPSVIENVRIVTHGFTQDAAIPDLPLKEGQTYSNGAAFRTEEILSAHYGHPGMRTKVHTAASITNSGNLQVVFHVLRFPENRHIKFEPQGRS